MAYNLLIANERTWLKDLSVIDKKTVSRILDKIGRLRQEPWPDEAQVTKLTSFQMADFRLRVGEYRVLFDRDLEKKQITLYRVLHRSKAYV